MPYSTQSDRLTRYAVRIASTQEVLDVGLKLHSAERYVASWNTINADPQDQAEIVPIRWTIPRFSFCQ